MSTRLRSLFLVALMVSMVAGSATAAEVTAPAERPSVSDFTLTNLEGKRVKLSSLTGKVVLVSFWATWCAPCKQELPFLDTFAARYADKGLVVLAISTDGPKSASEVRRTLSSKGLKLPVLLDGEGEVSKRLNPASAMPYTLDLDRTGKKAADHEGFSPGDEVGIEARIVALLAESAPKP